MVGRFKSRRVGSEIRRDVKAKKKKTEKYFIKVTKFSAVLIFIIHRIGKKHLTSSIITIKISAKKNNQLPSHLIFFIASKGNFMLNAHFSRYNSLIVKVANRRVNHARTREISNSWRVHDRSFISLKLFCPQRVLESASPPIIAPQHVRGAHTRKIQMASGLMSQFSRIVCIFLRESFSYP